MQPTNGKAAPAYTRHDAAHEGAASHHYRRPEERPFTRAEREHVTLLFGGLTRRHDRLIQAALQGVGYRAEALPTPSKRDYHTGREYGNNGMCNPTYFTAGALINRLKRLRAEGLGDDAILRDYAFITAGGCGPCRFGMYEAEYRLALHNSGFDGFRVIIFEQTNLRQSGPEAGVELNPEIFIAFLNALVIGDLLNEVACQLRPYEFEPGRVEVVMEEAVRRIEAELRVRHEPSSGWLAWLLGGALPDMPSSDRARILDQLLGRRFVEALRECAAMLEREVEVDFTRPKPVCKFIGEFWAQTTEGDGNFNMQSFLEAQGAETVPEAITTWANYVIAQEGMRRTHRAVVDANGVGSRLRARFQAWLDALRLDLAGRALNREYERYRAALGGTAHEQVDQRELRRLAQPFYNPKLSGGEGHLEVGKTIYYATRSLAHMVLSLKPFGCLPSTQSDGVQSAVTARYPEALFLPIETSGEGDINAYSRVQMILGEAKQRCREEFSACVARTGFTLDELRRYCAAHRELRRPLQRVPHHAGVAGRAANFVLYVGDLMRAERGGAGQRSRPAAAQESAP